MHVCVVGAGIVGLATAYELLAAGHRVTVVDQHEPTSGASADNGAQLSYSYVQPLADASIWQQLPRLLFSADSPLRVRPAFDVDQWTWLLRFLAACRPARSRSTTEFLLRLAAESRAAFTELQRSHEIACDFSSTGKLVVHRNRTSLEKAKAQIEVQRALGGSPQRAVTAAEAAAIEPALASALPKLAGAVFTADDGAVDCRKLCLQLWRIVQAQGAVFMPGRRVVRMSTSAGRVRAAITSLGDEVQADAFVLSAGVGTPALARLVGARVAILPLKGYSITSTLSAQGVAPTVNVTDSARKVVFARLGDRLRVAGMVEIGHASGEIDPRAIASLRASTESLFPGVVEHAEIAAWSGLRPATPTGLPVIGRLRNAPDNVYFNAGHGALGLTLAFGSARRLVSSMAMD